MLDSLVSLQYNPLFLHEAMSVSQWGGSDFVASLSSLSNKCLPVTEGINALPKNFISHFLARQLIRMPSFVYGIAVDTIAKTPITSLVI